MFKGVSAHRSARGPSPRWVLRVWPLQIALLYATLLWARPPVSLLGADVTWVTGASAAVGIVAAVIEAIAPRLRVWSLGFIIAPLLFRSLALLLGTSQYATPAGEAVAVMAYLTIFSAVVIVHVLSIPVAALPMEGERR